MNTTWYLHVHFVWLKLSNSSIVENLPVCLAAHGENFFDGHCRKRQTSTASPAKPGDLPAGLGNEAACRSRQPEKDRVRRRLLSGSRSCHWPHTRRSASPDI